MKSKHKKPYIVEHRYLTSSTFKWNDGNWHVWGRYATEKARNQAVSDLNKSRLDFGDGYYVEYRAAPDN